MGLQDSIEQAVHVLQQANSLWVGTGAGMGVDSGLPDFRGNDGFWKAYPPYRKLGLSFYDLADPRWFEENPRQAWGFYGHRRNLYRQTDPHPGFTILRAWIDEGSVSAFVFTSNVDGHFQKAGFPDRMIECHGSIHHLQCSRGCSTEIWPANENDIEVNEADMLAAGDLPDCHNCGAVARPNILMFGDYGWLDHRTRDQYARYERWLAERQGDLVALEIGAGTAVPTVRYEAERRGTVIIRVNPRESQCGQGNIGVACSAIEFFERADAIMRPNQNSSREVLK